VPADILIYAAIAAGLVFWLRNILGTRHGDEPRRPDPFSSREPKAPTLPKARANPRFAPEGLVPPGSLDVETMEVGLDQTMSIANKTAEQSLLALTKADRSFVLATFLKNAQTAFVTIVEAFAEGDRNLLGTLLGEDLYKTFEQAISEREKRGERASVEIHAVRKSEVLETRITGRQAFVTVRFVADETNFLRDAEDQLLFGHPDHVTETIDIWTFGRDLKSKSPVWRLYETRDEDANGEDEHKTVPDAKKK